MWNITAREVTGLFLNTVLWIAIILLFCSYNSYSNLEPLSSVIVEDKENTDKITKVSFSDEDLFYLSEAIFFEAWNQGKDGWKLVLEVILNRANHSAYPNSIKEVVSQKMKGVCQFSYRCENKSKVISPKHRDKIISWITEEFVKEDSLLPSCAMNYHTTWVKPSWSKKMTQVLKINDHIAFCS